MGMQPAVKAILGEQSQMIALFDDSAALEHDDRIGVADRGQTVRNDDARTIFHQDFQGDLNILLGELSIFAVASSRIRICGSAASARAKLRSWRWPKERFLSALAEHRVITPRQLHDEVMRAHGLRRREDLVLAAMAGIADIFEDRLRK